MIGILHIPYSDYAYSNYAYSEHDLNIIKAIGEWCLHGSVIFCLRPYSD